MIGILCSAIGLGVMLSFMIGPVFFVLLETAITKGIKKALVFELGVFLSDLCFIILALYSTDTFINYLQKNPICYYLGGGLLFIYAFYSFHEAKKYIYTPINSKDIVINKRTYIGYILKGFSLNAINIGVLGFWFVTIMLISPKLSYNIVYIWGYLLTVLGVYILVDVGKIFLAENLKHKLQQSNIKKLKIIISIFIFLCSIFLIYKGFLEHKI